MTKITYVLSIFIRILHKNVRKHGILIEIKFIEGTTAVFQDSGQQIYLKWRRISQKGHTEGGGNPWSVFFKE